MGHVLLFVCVGPHTASARSQTPTLAGQRRSRASNSFSIFGRLPRLQPPLPTTALPGHAKRQLASSAHQLVKVRQAHEAPIPLRGTAKSTTRFGDCQMSRGRPKSARHGGSIAATLGATQARLRTPKRTLWTTRWGLPPVGRFLAGSCSEKERRC